MPPGEATHNNVLRGPAIIYLSASRIGYSAFSEKLQNPSKVKFSFLDTQQSTQLNTLESQKLQILCQKIRMYDKTVDVPTRNVLFQSRFVQFTC